MNNKDIIDKAWKNAVLAWEEFREPIEDEFTSEMLDAIEQGQF